jgi:hypothetical protein
MNSFEKQLFNWDGWDDISPMCLQFYNVELVVPVGSFPIGTRFSCACVDGENSSLRLFDEDGTEHTFGLVLSVSS